MPGKTVHFAYATPLTLLDRLTMRLFSRKLRRLPWDELPWPSPIKAPLSITYHTARHLAANYGVKLYDLRERVVIDPREGDILLGHAWPDPESVVWRALENGRFDKQYIISPYNHDSSQVQWAYRAIEQCDRFFAVCGQYWIDTFDKSPFASFRDKVIRLNMGIDTADYPYVKNSFNPRGERKFFYIGRAGYEKGIDLLEQLANEVPGFQGGYICLGQNIKGWAKISEPTDLTPGLMRKIAEKYDVFINMSRADAQVTTVLEAMSWGFPVACTRESGFSEEKNLFYLDLDDMEQNVRMICQIQQMQSWELEEISRLNRIHVESNYTWERFLTTLQGNM